MPLPKGTTYGMVHTKKGNVRLAFSHGKVIEAKNMKTGAMHTPAEFKADRMKHKGHAAIAKKHGMKMR